MEQRQASSTLEQSFQMKGLSRRFSEGLNKPLQLLQAEDNMGRTCLLENKVCFLLYPFFVRFLVTDLDNRAREKDTDL